MLQMIGIDYNLAPIEVREKFSFSNDKAIETERKWMEKKLVQGIVILSTCNRTEIYVSLSEEKEEKSQTKELLEIFHEETGISKEYLQKYFVKRQKKEAVHHLFRLSCGMESKVYGEDQIITQVKNALFFAREAESTNRELERTFQYALAAAKKVKTNVRLSAVGTDVIEEVKKRLQKEGVTLQNARCLVIGNGQMGRLSAVKMIEAGAKVTMTVRSYKTRQVEIPLGCKVIDYTDRYEKIDTFDIIISATTSPHHTIKYEECHQLFSVEKKHYLFDLALPRDISSKFLQEPGIVLVNIDELGGKHLSKEQEEEVKKAEEILKNQEEKLWESLQIKEDLFEISQLGQQLGQLSMERVKKSFLEAVSIKDKETAGNLAITGAQKTITSMLFTLHKTLDKETFQACLDALRQNIE